MWMKAIRSFYVEDVTTGIRPVRSGDTYESDISTQKGRQQVYESIQNQQAVPADYPDTVEVEVTRSYSIGVANHGAVVGIKGDRRDLPRTVALQLICNAYARPTDKRLWSFELPIETEESKVRKLHAIEQDAVAASLEKKENSFVQSWWRR